MLEEIGYEDKELVQDVLRVVKLIGEIPMAPGTEDVLVRELEVTAELVDEQAAKLATKLLGQGQACRL